jgi:ssDNA-binding Zn-finger/Zn-ribbon topoisomerase 1
MIIQTKPVPYCPECGARMSLRRPKPDQSWEPFWGCSTFPECRGTRNIMSDGKPETDRDLDFTEEW